MYFFTILFMSSSVLGMKARLGLLRAKMFPSRVLLQGSKKTFFLKLPEEQYNRFAIKQSFTKQVVDFFKGGSLQDDRLFDDIQKFIRQEIELSQVVRLIATRNLWTINDQKNGKTVLDFLLEYLLFLSEIKDFLKQDISNISLESIIKRFDGIILSVELIKHGASVGKTNPDQMKLLLKSALLLEYIARSEEQRDFGESYDLLGDYFAQIDALLKKIFGIPAIEYKKLKESLRLEVQEQLKSRLGFIQKKNMYSDYEL